MYVLFIGRFLGPSPIDHPIDLTDAPFVSEANWLEYRKRPVVPTPALDANWMGRPAFAEDDVRSCHSVCV